MVLGFKTKFKDGTPTRFVQKILDGEKIHTMRVGARWREGMSIQMATGVRTKHYEQFNRPFPYLHTVRRVQRFEFWRTETGRLFLHIPDMGKTFVQEDPFVEQLAHFDGLASAAALFDWFRPDVLKLEPFQKLCGQIIHWNDTWYHPSCANNGYIHETTKVAS